MTLSFELTWKRMVAMRICPVCRARIEDFEQRACCVYNLPCGHRIGKGSADAVKAWFRAVEGDLPIEDPV